MDPFSIAAVGAGATALGGLVSAGGAAAKGEADQRMYQYKAGVAQLNAKIAKQNADYTQVAGGSAVYKEGLELGQTIGKQKAIQGASGLDVNSGTNVTVRDDTRKLGEYDQGITATNYAKKAYSYEVESATQTAEAGADIIAGDEAIKASEFNVASSLLGAAGSVSSKWLQASPAFGKTA